MGRRQEAMTELFKAGDPVPREWFSRLDNVKEMTFLHPCIVETTDERRTIWKAHPQLDGPLIYFSHIDDQHCDMKVAFDRETIIYQDADYGAKHHGGI
jgi:hypothetical protein